MERKHRHLLDIARALRLQAHLPTQFWSKCILTVTYIINELPMKKLNWHTQYELLFLKLPEYSHIRIFVCSCFTTNFYPHKDKFIEMSIKAMFLGYPNTRKAYKLFNLQTKLIFVNKDA